MLSPKAITASAKTAGLGSMVHTVRRPRACFYAAVEAPTEPTTELSSVSVSSKPPLACSSYVLASMPCHQAIRRNLCGAHNAYNPCLALRAAFTTTAPKSSEDAVRSMRNKSQSQTTTRRRDTHTATEVPTTASDEAWRQDLRAERKGHGQRAVSIRRVLAPSSRRVTDHVYRSRPSLMNEHAAIGRDDGPAAAQDGGSADEMYGGGKGAGAPTTKGRPSNMISAVEWQSHMLHIKKAAKDLRLVSATEGLDDWTDQKHEQLKHFLDYPPKIVMVKDSGTEHLPVPWTVSLTRARALGNGRDLLTWEIHRFADYMEATTPERIGRQAVVDDVKAFIDESLNSDAKLAKTGHELFGSEKTGLALPFSDIDIRIFDTSGHGDHRPRRLQNRMHLLYRALFKSERFVNPVYRHGNYPIVNCQHRASGIDIQIVSSPNTGQQQEIVAKFLAETPYLRETFVVARTFLSMRGLLDVYHGGMGSYALFVMLAAALKRTSQNISVSCGTQFRRFLQFYARLPITQNGVAVAARAQFEKRDRDPACPGDADDAQSAGNPVAAGQQSIGRRYLHQPYLLCLQDPADPFNDLGKRSHAIKHVIATIRYHNHVLREASHDSVESHAEVASGRHESLLEPFVGRCHEVYHHRRRKLHSYGLGVIERARNEHKREAASKLQQHAAPGVREGGEKNVQEFLEHAADTARNL